MAERLHAETGGNPLALAELAATLTAEQLDGMNMPVVPLPPGAAIRQRFAARLDQLSPPARIVLVVAAAGTVPNAPPQTGQASRARPSPVGRGILVLVVVEPAPWFRAGAVSVLLPDRGWPVPEGERLMDYGESFSPALLVPDPTRAPPRAFRLFTTGSALLRFADGLNGFCSSWPEGVGEEHSDVISALFSILRDWMNTSGGQGSIQARALDEHVKKLAKGGFVIGARERFFLLTGGTDAKALSWRIVDIKVQRSASTFAVCRDAAGARPVDRRLSTFPGGKQPGMGGPFAQALRVVRPNAR